MIFIHMLFCAWLQSACSCTLMRLGSLALSAALGAQHDSRSPAHLQFLKSTGFQCHSCIGREASHFICGANVALKLHRQEKCSAFPN